MKRKGPKPSLKAAIINARSVTRMISTSRSVHIKVYFPLGKQIGFGLVLVY